MAGGDGGSGDGGVGVGRQCVASHCLAQALTDDRLPEFRRRSRVKSYWVIRYDTVERSGEDLAGRMALVRFYIRQLLALRSRTVATATVSLTPEPDTTISKAKDQQPW